LKTYPSNTQQLPYAYGEPTLSGMMRSELADFKVTEKLGFVPSGSGQHIYYYINKASMTTLQVRDALARHSSCAARDIGYAGLKDKHAHTQQWFSVQGTIPLANSTFNIAEDSLAQWQIVESQFHRKKLTRGAHKGNVFCLRIRAIDADITDTQVLKAFSKRVDRIRSNGFPNYFGDQRFGYHGLNLNRAIDTFISGRRASRDKRGLYLSALRGFLFNELLKLRVAQGNWSRYCEGDLLMLNGTNSFFKVTDQASEQSLEPVQAGSQQDQPAEMNERLDAGDIHVAGLLCGSYYEASTVLAGTYERQVAEQYPELIECLNAADIKPARRAFRAIPAFLDWSQEGQDIVLDFELPTGSYATMLLRELLHYSDASAR